MWSWPGLGRGEAAAGEAGGIFRRKDARLAERRHGPALAGRVVAEEDDGAGGLRRTDVRVQAERIGGQRPQREGRRRRFLPRFPRRAVFVFRIYVP